MAPPDAFTFDVLMSYLLVGAALMVLGMLGFLARRNLIVMFLSTEMMIQGTALTLVGFGRYHGNWTGQVFTIVILTVAACEASANRTGTVASVTVSAAVAMTWAARRSMSSPCRISDKSGV